MKIESNLKEAIEYYCKILSLPLIKDIYIKESQEAAKGKITYQQFLYNLLKQQAEMRIDNSVKTKIKKAKFPFVKTIEEYDFSFQPKIDEKLIRELCNLNFMDEAKNIIFVGSHRRWQNPFAICIGLKAAIQKKKGIVFYR